jgi:hypothetical protein
VAAGCGLALDPAFGLALAVDCGLEADCAAVAALAAGLVSDMPNASVPAAASVATAGQRVRNARCLDLIGRPPGWTRTGTGSAAPPGDQPARLVRCQTSVSDNDVNK